MVVLAAAILCPRPARAQIAGPVDNRLLFRYSQPIRVGLIIPATGPEAAADNPARMAGTDHGFALLGKESGGRVSTFATEAGVGIRRTVYLGLDASSGGASLPGSNAIFLEALYQAMFAFRHDLDGEGREWLSLGYAFAIHNVNAMGVYKVTESDHALGFAYHEAPAPHRPGVDAGLSVRDPFPIDAERPPDYYGGPATRYRLYQWITDATLAITSSDSHWILHGDLSVFSPIRNAFPDDGPSTEGIGSGPIRMDFRRYGLEYHPWKFGSLRIERLWNRYWVLGLGGGPAFRSWRLKLDADFTHGRFLEHTVPDGYGWISSYRISADW